MSILLRCFVCLSGIVLLHAVFRKLVNRKLTERQCLFWIMLSFAMILVGIFQKIPIVVADMFGVEYAPSIVFALALLLAINGIYKCFCANAELEQRVNELAVQISLLNQEKEESLKNEKKANEKANEKENIVRK
jgi:hypothetical protein